MIMLVEGKEQRYFNQPKFTRQHGDITFSIPASITSHACLSDLQLSDSRVDDLATVYDSNHGARLQDYSCAASIE